MPKFEISVGYLFVVVDKSIFIFVPGPRSVPPTKNYTTSYVHNLQTVCVYRGHMVKRINNPRSPTRELSSRSHIFMTEKLLYILHIYTTVSDIAKNEENFRANWF
jgi:hypothetical protein